MRVLSLDYGSKTVGVAVSDALFLTAQPVETIVRKREDMIRPTLRRIEELVSEYGVTDLVLGWPVRLNGELSERTKKTEEFKKILEKRIGLPVHLQDERLTTVEAAEILRELGIRKEDEKKHIDKIAATLILEDFMKQEKKRSESDGKSDLFPNG